MQVLIGGSALHLFINGIRPRDVDYFSDTPIAGAETFYHPDLEKWEWGEVATLDELYTIKVSHIFWEQKNGSWNKHLMHIMLMQKHGAKLVPELYNILFPIWQELYGEKRGTLDTEPGDFFKDSVKRRYLHDSVHAAVALHGEPLFKSVLQDGHEILCDWLKFQALSKELQLDLVREEIYATALERYIFSDFVEWDCDRAYFLALKKTITSFWRGKWALFIVQNINELIRPKHNYIDLAYQNKDKLIKGN